MITAAATGELLTVGSAFCEARARMQAQAYSDQST